MKFKGIDVPFDHIPPKVWNKHHKNAPKDAVYVGRPSKWGNPYSISGELTREKVINYYRQHIAKKHDLIRQELRGKDLVCFCAPKPCHADVLLEIANEPKRCGTDSERPTTAEVGHCSTGETSGLHLEGDSSERE